MSKTRFANYCSQKERALLICPLCRAGLEAIQLNKDENGNQTIWWVCKNTFDNKCTFPGELPPDVFWVQRSAEDIELGIIPRPNADKIPKSFRYLYPALFPKEANTPSQTAAPPNSEEIQEVAEPDTSLISHFGSYESRPASDFDAASVVSVAPVPVESISGGSNSYTTGTSQSIASAPAGVVPEPSTSNESRKRPASVSPSKVPNPRFQEMVANHFLTLKEAGMDITKLKEIAQELIDQANDLETSETIRKRQRIPLITQDEYTDTIFQNVPEVKREQVAEAVKQKVLPQRLKIASLVRKTSSGAELLKMIGLAGSPLPENNKWREETNQKVNLNLRNAARHTRKAIEKRKSLATRPAPPPPSPLTLEEAAPAPISSSKAKKTAEERLKEEQQVELNIKKFINKKLRTMQEETQLTRKRAALEKKRRLKEQQELNRQPILQPIQEAPIQPLPEGTRSRLNSFSLMEYESDPFNSYPPMDNHNQFPPLDDGFSTGDAPLDDLFGNLNDLF